MVPKQFAHIPTAQIVDSPEDIECKIPTYKPQEDVFLSLIHVALKQRSGTLDQARTTCKNIKPKRSSTFTNYK